MPGSDPARLCGSVGGSGRVVGNSRALREPKRDFRFRLRFRPDSGSLGSHASRLFRRGTGRDNEHRSHPLPINIARIGRTVLTFRAGTIVQYRNCCPGWWLP